MIARVAAINGIQEKHALSATNGTASINPAPASPRPDLIEIDLFGAIRRYLSVVILCSVLGTGAAILYGQLARVVYQSRAEVMVLPKDSTLPMQTVSLGYDRPESGELLATHAKLILSPRIVRQALVSNDLLDLPSLRPHLSEKVDQVDYVVNAMKVQRGGEGAAKNAQVLSVTFRHTHAEDCKRILEAVLSSYEEFIEATAKGAGSEAAELISGKCDEIAATLAQQEESYREFREQAPVLFNHGESVNVHQLRVADLEQKLSELQLRKTAVRSRLDIVNASLADENADKYSDIERFALIDQADIQRLTLLLDVGRGDTHSEVFLAAQPKRAEVARTEFDKLVQLKLDVKTATQSLGANHPTVTNLKTQIQEIERILRDDEAVELDDTKLGISSLTSAYQNLLENDLEDIVRQERVYQTIIDEEREKAKSLISYELQEKNLASQVLRTKTLYDAVIDRLREINIAKDYGGFITEVIAPAELGEKAWPKRTLLAVLGLLGGGFMGAIVAFGLEYTDQSFRGVEDIRSTLKLPLLLQMPHVGRSSGRVRGSKIAREIVSYHDPSSYLAENVRQLRTFVCLRSAKKSGNVLQVTSSLPDDGKTMIATNLAVSLSQAGKKVLILDADMRQASVARTLAIESEYGLSDVLMGAVAVEEAVVDHPEIQGLHVLAGQERPSNPSELLMMPNYANLIRGLREQFDYIVVDSPPILSVIDPLVAAENADGVVVVVKLGKDTRRQCVKAVNLLRESGAKLLGLALNNSTSELSPAERQEVGYGFGPAHSRSGAYYTS